jgi:hypothetical protein
MQRKTEPVTMWFDARIVMRQSPIQGTGVFATDLIYAGEQLMRISGGVVYTLDDWQSGRVQLDGTKYNEEKIDDDLFVAVPKSIFYYVNHGCDPNFWGDHIARRDIYPGEEITADYALFQSFPSYRLEPCLCGSPLCRGKVTGDDWKLPELQERYQGQFTPYIERLIQQMGGANSDLRGDDSP